MRYIESLLLNKSRAYRHTHLQEDTYVHCAHMDKCLSINLINEITTETTIIIIIMRVLVVTIWKRKKKTVVMCRTCLLEPEIGEFNIRIE